MIESYELAFRMQTAVPEVMSIDGESPATRAAHGLDDAATADERNAKRRKIVKPNEMPWEMAPQGLLKHLINEAMNTRMETVDA